MNNKINPLNFSLKYLQRFPSFFIAFFLSIFMFAIEASLVPYIGQQISNLLASGTTSELLKQMLVRLLVLSIAIQFAIKLGERIEGYVIDTYIGTRMRYRIQIDLLNHLVTKNYAYYSKHMSGDLMAKIKDVIESLPEIIKISANSVFKFLLGIVVCSFFVWKVHPFFTAMILLNMILYIMGTGIAFGIMEKASYEFSSTASKVSGRITDFLNGIMNFKLFSKISDQKKLFEKDAKSMLHADIKMSWTLLVLFGVLGMIYVVITCLNVAGLYFLWKNGRIQPGDFLLVLGINHNTNAFLAYAVFQLGSIMQKYGQAAQAIDEILNVDAPENHEKCNPISVSEGRIEVKDLVFGYNAKNTILNGVSFKINPGEKICIVGPSGSGKSTIVKLLLRLYRPTSGSIMIDNQDIQDVNIEDLNQNIGAMPQDIFVFNRSIKDNICYNNEPIEEVIAIAKRIGIHDAIMKLKNGYDTIIGEGAEDDLSGGQKQRISAVRALIRAKHILILDEPTSHLDVRTTKLVHREIKKICSENKTTLITVAHNLEAVADVSIDKVMVVVDGKVVEFGPHMDLLKNKGGIYYSMWNAHLTQVAEEKSMEHPAEEGMQQSL